MTLTSAPGLIRALKYVRCWWWHCCTSGRLAYNHLVMVFWSCIWQMKKLESSCQALRYANSSWVIWLTVLGFMRHWEVKWGTFLQALHWYFAAGHEKPGQCLVSPHLMQVLGSIFFACWLGPWNCFFGAGTVDSLEGCLRFPCDCV